MKRQEELRATSYTSQEPWPWNCERPKERGDIKTPPYELWGVLNPGGGNLPVKFPPAREIFESDRKLLSDPPDFEKNIALAFLKATWLQIPYWVHFTFKVSNPIYMCTST